MFGMFLPSLFSGHRPYPKVLGSLADGLLRISYPSIWRQFIFYRYVSCYLLPSISRHYPKYATPPLPLGPSICRQGQSTRPRGPIGNIFNTIVSGFAGLAIFLTLIKPIQISKWCLKTIETSISTDL